MRRVRKGEYGMSLTESRYEVEKDWECTKLLICEDTDRRYLAFALGQYGIYLESFSRMEIKGGHYNMHNPSIATIRYCKYDCVLDFIMHEKQFKSSIIFKHGKYFMDLETDAIGLANNVMLNAMGLRPGSIFYIHSNDKEAQDLFYHTAVKINEQSKLECKFDCDCYNYKITIKRYNKTNGKFVLVVIMTGTDMPNTWKFNPEEFCEPECDCECECEETCCVPLGNYTISVNGIWELGKPRIGVTIPTHAAPEPEWKCLRCIEECCEYDECFDIDDIEEQP